MKITAKDLLAPGRFTNHKDSLAFIYPTTILLGFIVSIIGVTIPVLGGEVGIGLLLFTIGALMIGIIFPVKRIIPRKCPACHKRMKRIESVWKNDERYYYQTCAKDGIYIQTDYRSRYTD